MISVYVKRIGDEGFDLVHTTADPDDAGRKAADILRTGAFLRVELTMEEPC